MRISNWTQFAKIFGDPNEPDNGPFMEGAYLAHSVYGFFQNGGNLCWVVRVGDDGGGSAALRAALPAAADASVEAYRVVALEAGNGDVKVELTEEPSAGEKDGDKSYKLVVSSGGDEEHEGLNTKKGRTNIATKVNSASKLVKIEEDGVTPRRSASRRPAATRCRSRRSSPTRSSRPTSRATWPAARAWAAWPPSTR